MYESAVKKEHKFPNLILNKWQKLIDLISSSFDLPATLIMEVDVDAMKVFAKCNADLNPYSVGSIEKMAGLYCETVVKNNDKLLVPNALLNPDWDKNPDIKLGMIAYLGFPLKYPTGEVFGTLCVLDDEENHFSKTIEDFLLQVKHIIELDLLTYTPFGKDKSNIEEANQFSISDQKDDALSDINIELSKHKNFYKVLNEKTNVFNQELLKREQKYETLFSSMNTALVILKPIFNSKGELCDAEYIDMNSNNETVLGYKKEEILGKTILDIFPNTEADWFYKFEKTVRKKNSTHFESYHEPLDKYFSGNAFYINDDAFGISFYDITNQELLKQKLIESERRYKTIFYESSSIMMLVDPHDSAIVDANSAAIQFYGYPKDDLLKMKMNEINTMSNEDLMKEIDRAKQKKKNHFQFKHQLASGEIRDVEVYSGTILSDDKSLLHSVIHDVTERCVAEENVTRLSMAVDQSPVAVVITNLTGDILYCNPKHCELTGYSHDEIIGNNPRILKSGKLTSCDYRSLWETITAGNKWYGEFFNKRKDGSYYWELASIAPIKDKHGEIVNFVKLGEDISERKKLENKLSQSKLKAEESDKLKSSFLANLSHEVRTPLNSIMGFTNLMLSEGISDEERKEYGGFVESSSNQLITMMDNILKISMIELGQMSLRFSTFKMCELFHEIKSYYQQAIADKNLEFIVDNDCEFMIKSDRKRMRQVLDNLVSNALKFTSEGKIILKVEHKKNMLLLSVEDTGIGIAPQNHNLIFERFMQLENLSTRKFDGSGLGLSISKEIVILLGGEIWLESEIGKGTKFIFTIPNTVENKN